MNAFVNNCSRASCTGSACAAISITQYGLRQRRPASKSCSSDKLIAPVRFAVLEAVASKLRAAWKRRMRCDLVEHRFFAGTDVGLICLLHRKVQSAFFSARLFLSDVLRRIRIER